MNKKGISLIVLLVTIGIIIILASTVTISGVNVYNNANKIKFASEVAYVQDIVESYMSNNNGRYPSTVKIYVDTTKIDSLDLSSQFEGEQFDETVLVLNKIDLSLLNTSTLTYGTSTESESDDVYAISSTTGKIYYVRGKKIGGNTYYILNDDLKRKISYKDSRINDGILFLNKGMDNGKCKIDIKIPLNYSQISVLSTDGSFSYTTENDGGYRFYKTNSGASGVITVKYKTSLDGDFKEIKYNVDNVDSESPSFDLSGVQTMLNTKTGQIQKYVSILNLSDNLSGIKWVKYATSRVDENDAKDFFQNKGIIVENQQIEITKSGYYSVYAEDNAGNIAVKYLIIE